MMLCNSRVGSSSWGFSRSIGAPEQVVRDGRGHAGRRRRRGPAERRGHACAAMCCMRSSGHAPRLRDRLRATTPARAAGCTTSCCMTHMSTAGPTSRSCSAITSAKVPSTGRDARQWTHSRSTCTSASCGANRPRHRLSFNLTERQIQTSQQDPPCRTGRSVALVGMLLGPSRRLGLHLGNRSRSCGFTPTGRRRLRVLPGTCPALIRSCGRARHPARTGSARADHTPRQFGGHGWRG
jgi:hypothetical protein